MNLWAVNRRKILYRMGTKKNGHFGKNFRAPGGSYTRRERGFAAQAPRTGPPPACPSVPPAPPSSHTPPRKKYPSPHQAIHPLPASTFYKSSRDTQAGSTKISFRGTRQFLLYLRSHSTKINFAAVIIASRSWFAICESNLPVAGGDALRPANSLKIGKSEKPWKSGLY